RREYVDVIRHLPVEKQDDKWLWTDLDTYERIGTRDGTLWDKVRFHTETEDLIRRSTRRYMDRFLRKQTGLRFDRQFREDGAFPNGNRSIEVVGFFEGAHW